MPHRVLDHIAGVANEPRLEVRLVGRSVASIAVLAVVGGALLATSYALCGAPVDMAVALFAALGGGPIVLLWRRTRRQRVVLHLTLTWYLIAFFVGGVVTHGLAYIAWFATLPLAAFFIGGHAEGRLWSAATMVALALIVAHLLLGAPPDQDVPLAALIIRAVGLPPILATMGYLFERSRSDALKELDDARLLALRANDARGRLLAKVSHEIRTPLNGVLGLTQSLLAQELPPAVRDDLTLVHESGAGLVSLINDLLDLSRAESGALEVHAAPVDLHRLVREVGGIHKATALHKHLTLEVLGAPEAPCWVSTDAARLRQVVGNLVSNAVKFTERGGVTIALSIEPLDAATLTATIAVTDTGRGLSERDLGQLFKPFVQLHADKAHEGTGLGLVISRELATRLGGALTVQSVEGSGSTFTLTLRLPGAVAPEAGATTRPLRPFRVLVVDDNGVNRRVARALLERLGGAVQEANDGLAALDAVTASAPDLVCMDLQMPVLDGLEATRRLRTRGFHGPVLALTASAGPETEAECRAAGMNGCLAKPLQLERLREVLERTLEARAA